MKKARKKEGRRADGRASQAPSAAFPLSVDWVRAARISVPEPKQPISFRVDPDVLDFFKEQGPRYQTRMNAVLRAYMTAHTGDENT